jgi:hypothetical protein
MDWRAFAAAALLLAPALTLSGGHPEEAHPNPEVSAEFDPYSGLVSREQERLRALGFLDDPALAKLGVERSGQAATGSTSEPQR